MHEFNSVETITIVSIIVAYILGTGWLTVRLRSKNNEQFMVAARAMPAAIVGVLLMSEYIGAKSTVGTAQEAFNSGIAASWSVIAAGIGFLLFGLFFVRKVYTSGEFTISGVLRQKYGQATMVIVSLVMIYALFVVNVGNYISGAAALATILKINIPLAMVIIGAVSTFYFTFGGLKGVAYVTLLHSVMKLFGIAIILGFGLYLAGGIKPMAVSLPPEYFTATGNIGVSTIVAWIIGTVGSIFSTQFVIQAISGSKSANDARRSCFFAAALCFPVGIALGLIGICARYLHPGIKSIYALPVFLQNMHPAVAGFVATSLVASVFVSVSTVALAIASLVVKDFYVPLCNPTPERQMRTTHIVSIVIGLAPLVFCFSMPQILRLSFFTRAIRMSISVIALVGFYMPFFRSSVGAIAGILTATIMTSLWYYWNNPYGIDNMYIALLVPIVVIAAERIVEAALGIRPRSDGC